MGSWLYKLMRTDWFHHHPCCQENEALRKTMGRWQERRRSAPSILDNKVFLEKDLLSGYTEQQVP